MKKLLLSIGVVLTSISLNAQVVNGGFETWTTGSISGLPVPANWNWFSGLDANTVTSAALGGTVTANGVATAPCTKGTTGAPEGSSYVKLTTVTRSGSTQASYDGVYGGTIIQTLVTTSQPSSFSFKYKYAAANSDSAIVFIQGTKWNGSSAAVVGQGYYIVAANASSWTTVTNQAINWASAPDTLEIFISSSIGDVLSGGYTPQDNSIFEVDQFTMAGGTASINELTANTVSIYPNPATTVLNIDSKESVSAVEILTTDGKVVATTANTSNISVEALNAGMYIYRVTTVSGKVETGNFVKN